MPTPTYISIASITLSSNVSSVTFGSIPQTYRDLVIAVTGTVSLTGDLLIEFNGNSSNLSYVKITSDGSTAATSRNRVGLFTTESQIISEIIDYSVTNKHKLSLTRASAADEEVAQMVSRWANTAAITSCKIEPSNGVLQTGTTLALYGIEA